MSDDRTNAGDDADRPKAKRLGGAFDRTDGYSGQDYSREREEAQGSADTAPREKIKADPPPPEDPDSFGVEPGQSKGALTGNEADSGDLAR